ncbi:bet v i allergen, partial [Diplodia corticola]
MSREEVAKKEVLSSVTETINAPIEEVWPYVAAIGTEKLWILGCFRSALVSGSGKGAVRKMHFNHGIFTERIEDCDHETYRFVYRVLEPHPLPGQDPVGIIQLERDGTSNEHTKFTWTGTADRWDAELKPLARELARRTHLTSIATIRK